MYCRLRDLSRNRALLALLGTAAAAPVQTRGARTKVENQQCTSEQRHVFHDVCHLVLRHNWVAHRPKVMNHDRYGNQEQNDQRCSPLRLVTQRDAETPTSAIWLLKGFG